MSAPRPTLRSLAAKLGVSPMTVSLALRNSHEVSAKTRRRIQRLARTEGYRPDPTISKLMHHLRLRAPKRSAANICAIGQRDPPHSQWNGFIERMIAGMRHRAEALGYAFSTIEIENDESRATLPRVLHSRGIDGLAILPPRRVSDFRDLVDWREFSTVAATSAVVAPVFHRVMPNHFDNMLTACQALTAAGFRRIGLAVSSDFNRRVLYRWTGGIAWHHEFGGTTAVRTFVGRQDVRIIDVDPLRKWLTREKPDAIISDINERPALSAAIAHLPARRRPQLFHMSWPDPAGEPGIDQRPEQLGSVAIEVLAGMLARGEKGVPDLPSSSMVDGRWMSGQITPPSAPDLVRP